MSGANGKFVWQELMTTDVNAAKAFYGDVVGWKTQDWPGEDKYWVWMMGETPRGGVTMLQEDQLTSRVAPYWLGTLATEDVDVTVKKALAMGGKVLAPAMDVPDVGRVAVLADPQGAKFGVMSSPKMSDPPAGDVLGAFGWAELNTTDWKSAWKFYAELFGWKKTDSMDMGPELGEYFMFTKEGDRSMGAMCDSAKLSKTPPQWLFYVTVKDADATASRLDGLGAKLLDGPMDVPGGDRVAQCRDPQGAVFAIYSAGTAVKK